MAFPSKKMEHEWWLKNVRLNWFSTYGSVAWLKEILLNLCILHDRLFTWKNLPD
jgi:hypothetical protein